MLSNYQLNRADLYNILFCNVKKFVTNYFDNEKYVIYYKNLQLYLRLGLKLKNLQRALESNHSQWLTTSIEFNT